MNIERVKGSTNRFGALGGTRGRCLGTLGGCRIHRRSFGAFAGLAGARIKASTTRFGALGGCRVHRWSFGAFTGLASRTASDKTDQKEVEELHPVLFGVSIIIVVRCTSRNCL